MGLAIPLANTGFEGEIRGTFSLPSNALPAGQQLICTMSFRARSVPETLETFLDMKQLTITNPNGIILSSGTEVISEPVRVLVRKFDGDNNANNKLDVGDATRIQRLLVGLETARSWDVFGNDTNGNDELDPGDVTRVLRTVVAIDPQPKSGGNRDIQKMGGGDDSPEKALIKVTEKTADTVTVQVVLKDMISQISGASFELKYPVEMLRLRGKDSHRRGEMASKAARYMWNVEPSQSDYTSQDGTIAMAAVSSEQWSIKEGVLAELTFEVQDGADLSKAVLALSEVEVTPDGFDNRVLDGLEINVGSGATAEPSIIEIVTITMAPFSFSFGAKEGRVYDVQSSEDLRSWGTLKSYDGTGTLVRFEDETDQFFPQIYYRIRVVE